MSACSNGLGIVSLPCRWVFHPQSPTLRSITHNRTELRNSMSACALRCPCEMRSLLCSGEHAGKKQCYEIAQFLAKPETGLFHSIKNTRPANGPRAQIMPTAASNHQDLNQQPPPPSACSLPHAQSPPGV